MGCIDATQKNKNGSCRLATSKKIEKEIVGHRVKSKEHRRGRGMHVSKGANAQSAIHLHSLSNGRVGWRVGFDVGRLPIRFWKRMGRRCSHVLKHKPSPSHILAVSYYVEGRGRMPLDFHAFNDEYLTYKCWSPKVLKTSSRKRSRWAHIWEDGSSELANTNPTLADFMYIWTGLSLFTLEFGGRAAYMKTHSKHLKSKYNIRILRKTRDPTVVGAVIHSLVVVDVLPSHLDRKSTIEGLYSLLWGGLLATIKQSGIHHSESHAAPPFWNSQLPSKGRLTLRWRSPPVCQEF